MRLLIRTYAARLIQRAMTVAVVQIRASGPLAALRRKEMPSPARAGDGIQPI